MSLQLEQQEGARAGHGNNLDSSVSFCPALFRIDCAVSEIPAVSANLIYLTLSRGHLWTTQIKSTQETFLIFVQ